MRPRTFVLGSVALLVGIAGLLTAGVSQGTIGSVMLIIGGFLFYFVPAFVARHKKHRSGILALNLLLGWTILGWIGALIWALSDPQLAS